MRTIAAIIVMKTKNCSNSAGSKVGERRGLGPRNDGIYFMVESHKCTGNIHSV